MFIHGKEYRDPTPEEQVIIDQYKNEWEKEIDSIPPSDPSRWPGNHRETDKLYYEATMRYSNKIIALLTSDNI